MKDEIAKKLGFISWFDMYWSIYSWVRSPWTNLEDLWCKFFGHSPNMKTLIGKDWSDEKQSSEVTCISTHCSRCLKILDYKLV